MNDYVAGGYGALAAILGLYVVHLRHRARVLARALPPPPATPSPLSSPSVQVPPS